MFALPFLRIRFGQLYERQRQGVEICVLCYKCFAMEQRTLRNVKNGLNTNIYSYLETCGGQSSNQYLNIVHFFNTSVNQTCVASEDSCFPALVSNTRCSIAKALVVHVLPLCVHKGFDLYAQQFTIFYDDLKKRNETAKLRF